MSARNALLIATLVSAAIVGFPTAPATEDASWREIVEASLLEEVDRGASSLRTIVQTVGPARDAALAAGALGAHVFYMYDLIDAFAAMIPADLLDDVARLPSVQKVWRDAETYALLESSRRDIGTPQAEALGWTGLGVTVALLDTGVSPVASSMGGVNPLSPGLANKIVICQQFLLGVRTPYCVDGHGHGTHTASTAAGSAVPNTGVARNANVAIFKILTDAGSGFVSDGVAALNYIVLTKSTNGIDVISMSVGTAGGNGNGAFSLAAEAAWNAGFVVVAAAGNSGPGAGTILSPGDARKILTVGAVNENQPTSNTDDTIASFSSRGPTTDGRIKPEIVAPGVAVTANCVLTLSCTFSGTSMATPHVAGVAALILQKHPTWTPDQVRSALLTTAIKQSADGGSTPNNNYGYGLVWAPGALAL